MKASWNNVVIAESEETIEVEGNHYFPPGSIKDVYFKASSHSSVCPWKGAASYYHVEVDGEQNADAAWYYADPKPEAEHIRGYLAFWKGVSVE